MALTSSCCLSSKDTHCCCNPFKEKTMKKRVSCRIKEMLHSCDRLTALPAKWYRDTPQSPQSRKSQPDCSHKPCHHQRLRTTGIGAEFEAAQTAVKDFMCDHKQTLLTQCAVIPPDLSRDSLGSSNRQTQQTCPANNACCSMGL